MTVSATGTAISVLSESIHRNLDKVNTAASNMVNTTPDGMVNAVMTMTTAHQGISVAIAGINQIDETYKKIIDTYA